MTIPKIIYQTWKTKSLPLNVQKVRDKISKINPEYKLILFDDDDIDNFIKKNFDIKIYNLYKKLNVGAAKADFWRYCILYINGGVYLDIDSDIIRPLDELIEDEDKCIITREGNLGFFNNWIMIFEKHHPILLETIIQCCYNIENKITNDICYLTGPHGPFTNSINKIMLHLYNLYNNINNSNINITNLYFEKDEVLNSVFNNKNNNNNNNNELDKVRCKFYKIDMGTFAKWKHDYIDELYKSSVYWRNEKKIFND